MHSACLGRPSVLMLKCPAIRDHYYCCSTYTLSLLLFHSIIISLSLLPCLYLAISVSISISFCLSVCLFLTLSVSLQTSHFDDVCFVLFYFLYLFTITILLYIYSVVLTGFNCFCPRADDSFQIEDWLRLNGNHGRSYPEFDYHHRIRPLSPVKRYRTFNADGRGPDRRRQLKSMESLLGLSDENLNGKHVVRDINTRLCRNTILFHSSIRVNTKMKSIIINIVVHSCVKHLLEISKTNIHIH